MPGVTYTVREGTPDHAAKLDYSGRIVGEYLHDGKNGRAGPDVGAEIMVTGAKWRVLVWTTGQPSGTGLLIAERLRDARDAESFNNETLVADVAHHEKWDAADHDRFERLRDEINSPRASISLSSFPGPVENDRSSGRMRSARGRIGNL